MKQINQLKFPVAVLLKLKDPEGRAFILRENFKNLSRTANTDLRKNPLTDSYLIDSEGFFYKVSQLKVQETNIFARNRKTIKVNHIKYFQRGSIN